MSKHVPSLRRHKPSSQGVVTLHGRDFYLGKWPSTLKNPPPEVKQEYDRLIAEWLANGRRFPQEESSQPSLSINELILAFWTYAEDHYRHPDGSPTGELEGFKLSLRPLRQLYGDFPVTDFGPLKLKAVREEMIAADLSRGVINQRISRVVSTFKWGVGEELVPEPVWRALTAVRSLQRGRTSARETDPVQPVSDEVIVATIPFLTAPIRAMVQLQRLTGMRPGEVMQMRARDLDHSNPIWLYRPRRHKTKHHEKDRVIPLGPRAQEILEPFLKRSPEAYLFRPQDAVERLYRDQPRKRKKARPKKKPGSRYTRFSYNRALARACDKAFPAPVPLGQREGETKKAWRERLTAEQTEALKRWQKEHRWHPNQLRHTYATELRKQHGLEAAQVALGHATANVTQVYAERDLSLAIRIAAAQG